MTILVRDEERVLEANLRYHLSRGVDLIIATDNRSVDRTSEILRKYERRGVLKYIYEPADDFSQDQWVTRMANLAADCGADWIFHVDADEFWWPNRRGCFKQILSTIPEGVHGLIVQRSNFVYLGDQTESSFYARQVYREKQSPNGVERSLPPKVCHRGFNDIWVHQGNHSFAFEGRRPCVRASDAFVIFHFPIHSSAQFKHKVQVGGAAYARNHRLPDYMGRRWKDLYQEHLSDPAALDRYIDKMEFTHEDVRRSCRTGRLVYDRRLRDYMEYLDEHPACGAGAGPLGSAGGRRT